MLTADISKFAGSDIYWAFKSHDFYLFSFTAFMIWSHYSGQHDCYCCIEVVLYWELGCYCDVQSCVSHCAGVNVILANMDSGMLEDENIFFINCLLWIQFSTVNHHHYQHDFIICVCCVLLMWSAVISKAGREGSAVGLSHIDRSLEPSSASSAPPSLSLHHKCNQNNHIHNQDMQLLHNQTDPSLISLPNHLMPCLTPSFLTTIPHKNPVQSESFIPKSFSSVFAILYLRKFYC